MTLYFTWVFHYFPSESVVTKLSIIYPKVLSSNVLPVSFVQWITHIFPDFASLKFNALFFSISETLLGLNRKNEAVR